MKSGFRTCREAVGLNRGELAEAVGATRQTINAIERGQYNPSLELAFKPTAYFDCRVEDPLDPELGADLAT